MKTCFTQSLFFIKFLVLVKSLNLKNHGIWDNYYASSIAVHRNRAFLALPRSSCFNNLTDPTLIEVYWNGDHQNLIAGRKLFFPSEKHQRWGKCDQLQDVVSVDVETKKARLWVLDKGTNKCPPKIVVYNLYTNFEIYVCKLEGASHGDLKFLVVDSLGAFGSIAYVGGGESGELILVSFNDRKWWTVRISGGNGSKIAMSPERLAVSITEPILYLTSDLSTELFSINLTAIRSLDIIGSQTTIRDIEATFIGHKLGPSAGMTTDLAGGLNYYFTRDFAVLRWFTSKPLKAEYHDVLMQSYEALPYVPHLFDDPFNNIWALVNPLRPQECKNLVDRKHIQLSGDVPFLQSRVVKLAKFMKKNRKGRRGNLLFVRKPKYT